MAIITGDEKTLTAAPGIGKKIAQRIILELKDKLSKGQESGALAAGGASSAGAGKAAEVAAALAVLGYSQSEISAAMRGIEIDALSLEEVIRQALKRMVKG